MVFAISLAWSCNFPSTQSRSIASCYSILKVGNCFQFLCLLEGAEYVCSFELGYVSSIKEEEVLSESVIEARVLVKWRRGPCVYILPSYPPLALLGIRHETLLFFGTIVSTPNRSYCRLLNPQVGKLCPVSVHVRRAKLQRSGLLFLQYQRSSEWVGDMSEGFCKVEASDVCVCVCMYTQLTLALLGIRQETLCISVVLLFFSTIV